MNLAALETSYKWNYTGLVFLRLAYVTVFCDLLSVMPSSFTRVVACVRIAFLSKSG